MGRSTKGFRDNSKKELKEAEHRRERNLAMLKKRLNSHQSKISSVERRIEKRKKNIHFLDHLIKEKKIIGERKTKLQKTKNAGKNEIEKSNDIVKTGQEKLREIKEKIDVLEEDIKRGKIEKIKKYDIGKNRNAQILLERKRLMINAMSKKHGAKEYDKKEIKSDRTGNRVKDRAPRAQRIRSVRRDRGDFRFHQRRSEEINIPESLIPISLSSPKKKDNKKFKESFCFIINKDWEYKFITNNRWLNTFKKDDRLISIASNDGVIFKSVDTCDIYVDINDILLRNNVEYGVDINEEDKKKIENICSDFLISNITYIYSNPNWKKFKTPDEIFGANNG